MLFLCYFYFSHNTIPWPVRVFWWGPTHLVCHKEVANFVVSIYTCAGALWAMQSGQEECLHGELPLHTHIRRTFPLARRCLPPGCSVCAHSDIQPIHSLLTRGTQTPEVKCNARRLQPASQEGLQQLKRVACLQGKLQVIVPTKSTAAEHLRKSCKIIPSENKQSCDAWTIIKGILLLFLNKHLSVHLFLTGQSNMHLDRRFRDNSRWLNSSERGWVVDLREDSQSASVFAGRQQLIICCGSAQLCSCKVASPSVHCDLWNLQSSATLKKKCLP